MARGGYRQPNNPAPTSGPGALSQRTDGGATEGMTQPQKQYTGFGYGQNKGLAEQQSGAPLAGSGIPGFNFTPLDAPTERPNQPVTAGIDLGEGGGSELMRDLPNYAPSLTDTLKRLAQYDPSGDAELIYRQLLDKGY
jgi:hypothetical protein